MAMFCGLSEPNNRKKLNYSAWFNFQAHHGDIFYTIYKFIHLTELNLKQIYIILSSNFYCRYNRDINFSQLEWLKELQTTFPRQSINHTIYLAFGIPSGFKAIILFKLKTL